MRNHDELKNQPAAPLPSSDEWIQIGDAAAAALLAFLRNGGVK